MLSVIRLWVCMFVLGVSECCCGMYLMWELLWCMGLFVIWIVFDDSGCRLRMLCNRVVLFELDGFSMVMNLLGLIVRFRLDYSLWFLWWSEVLVILRIEFVFVVVF